MTEHDPRDPDEPGWAAPAGGPPAPGEPTGVPHDPPREDWWSPATGAPDTPAGPGPAGPDEESWWGTYPPEPQPQGYGMPAQPPGVGPPPGHGQPAPYGPQMGYGIPGQHLGPPRTSPKAIWSLVLALVGLVFCGILLGPVAIALGIVARRDINRSYGALRGDGLAIAGVVIGILTTIAAIVMMFVILGDEQFAEDLLGGQVTP